MAIVCKALHLRRFEWPNEAQILYVGRRRTCLNGGLDVTPKGGDLHENQLCGFFRVLDWGACNLVADSHCVYRN